MFRLRPVRLALELAASAAVADDAHQELAEALVQFVDVAEDAHVYMVPTAGAEPSIAGNLDLQHIRMTRSRDSGHGDDYQ